MPGEGEALLRLEGLGLEAICSQLSCLLDNLKTRYRVRKLISRREKDAKQETLNVMFVQAMMARKRLARSQTAARHRDN